MSLATSLFAAHAEEEAPDVASNVALRCLSQEKGVTTSLATSLFAAHARTRA